MEQEIYRPVVGYEGLYEVSNNGKVLSVRSQKLLSGRKTEKGYIKFTLAHRGFSKSFFAHRLVAEAFIHNPDSKPFVNHLDSNRANNNVDNLEWCTGKENLDHARKYGNFDNARFSANGMNAYVKKFSIPVAQYTLDGVFIKSYASVKEAELNSGVSSRSIIYQIDNKLKTVPRFFIWKGLNNEVARKRGGQKRA